MYFKCLVFLFIAMIFSGCTNNANFYPAELKDSFSTKNIFVENVAMESCTNDTFTLNVSGTLYAPYGYERINCKIEESAGPNNFNALEIEKGKNQEHTLKFGKTPIVQRTNTEPLELCCQRVSKQSFEPLGENFCVTVTVPLEEQQKCPLK